MRFVVTKNEYRGVKDGGFTIASNKDKKAFEALIEEIKSGDVGRDQHPSTKGSHRIDMTNPSDKCGLIQMQSGTATYATAIYNRDMESDILANFVLFKAALSEAFRICQETAYNTIITWE